MKREIRRLIDEARARNAAGKHIASEQVPHTGGWMRPEGDARARERIDACIADVVGSYTGLQGPAFIIVNLDGRQYSSFSTLAAQAPRRVERRNGDDIKKYLGQFARGFNAHIICDSVTAARIGLYGAGKQTLECDGYSVNVYTSSR